jgi:hypothetical protein
MELLAKGAEVEVGVASGILRVSVRHKPRLTSLLLTAVLIAAFAAIVLSSRKQSVPVVCVGEVLIILGAVVAWFQQLSGSEEEIEIGERGIRIKKEALGWHRVAEFPIAKCSDLHLQIDRENSRRLHFRFGKWRTIEFGNYMSNEQAEKVLNTLADSLPEVAQKLLPSLDVTKHWTILNPN